MTHRDKSYRRLGWAILLVLTVPQISSAGTAPQGITLQGITLQGITLQGITLQGITLQGITLQGITLQGQQVSGVALMGTDLVKSELAGVDIASVEIRGTTADSAVQPCELTSRPGISTGTGDYISVGGASAVGHYAVAHLVDPAGNAAEDLDLYIADERPDPAPNLLHRGDAQANEDVTLYTVFAFHASSGQWASLCPFDAATGGATAMAIAEDPAAPGRFIFACTAGGVASKCARGWGFRPWRTQRSFVYDDAAQDWVERTFAMQPFYDACKLAARAAYCQDRKSFTRDGTLVDLFDTRQLVWPNAIENPFGDDPDSRWMFAQELFVSVDPLVSRPDLKASALQRTRYRELSPVGQCAELAFVDRLEQDHFEDGRWASPLTNTPRVQVLSPNYCAHSEHEVGTGLAWDCSPCTTSVCKLQPRCCRLDHAVDSWDALCVAQAAATCDDPPGRVWPRDLPATVSAPPKFLVGPGGAVERVDGAGDGDSAATLAGWACDPEWPGAAVAVAIHGGAPRELPGSTLLGVVRADQALASPLSLEVSAACDGVRAPAARHGFSFTPPAGSAGPFFVYALDAATADGPAAPPTLVRNGIVDLQTSAAGGMPRATVTTGWIEAPVSGSYTFSAGLEPSRLYVNGRKLVDWWAGAGPTEGSIDLVAGGKYHMRWDRFEPAPRPPDSAVGLIWRSPGSAAQAPIPSSLLYRLAPGYGAGLAATYFDDSGFTGPAVQRLDAVVDLGMAWPATTRLPAGVAAPNFSVIWQGEIVPDYSDAYTFVVTSAGRADLSIAGQALLPPEQIAPPLAPACRHDICALGDKLAASTSHQPACHPCVDQICAQDPFCCNGGYRSYYATEPEWDAKCVTEVSAICGLACTNPLPSPTTRQRMTAPVLLQAGVRYPIRLAVDNDTADVTTQLAWESARQARAVVPARALYAAAAGAEAAGAGLNVVVFARGPAHGTDPPDLDEPLAAGATPDLSLRPPAGATGLPLIDVIASPDVAAAAAPPPPAVVSPRRGARQFQPAPQVSLTVLGGVRGGGLRARVPAAAGQPGIDVVLPFDADGNLVGGVVPVGSHGAHTLLLTQRTNAGVESAAVSWDVVVDAQAPAAPPPPVMLAPRDPTSSPDPTANVFRVSGRGLPAPVQICDRGGAGQSGVIAQSLQAADDGTISGSVTLTAGTAVDANPGWHKLSLSQDECATSGKPSFVSVGIRPPTVEFPRSGAPVDCSVVNPGQLVARGTIPYPESSFGRLVVAEELGRFALGLIQALVTVDPTPQPDGSFRFQAVIPAPALPLGKHLLYFFQAPAPPANATQQEIDAHYRAFASVAATPKSRIAVALPPPPLGLPAGGGALTSVAGLVLGASGCALTLGGACALPGADVNVHDGPRVWTTRASDAGDWQITLADITTGWHQLTFGQVVDSPAGGGWLESCPSTTLPVGIGTTGAGAPVLQLPGGLSVDATSVAGALLDYTAGATTASGAPLPVDCQPPSGALFPLGTSNVLCTAVDPPTGAVAVGTFPVTVVDGPPVIDVDVPPGGIVAEAASALGAFVSYAVTANDAVSGPVPVECTPSATPGQPALFPLGDTTVTCQATDGAQHTATRTFVVRVRDTTPPALHLPGPLQLAATSAQGARVTYATTATDSVDPAPQIACVPASGADVALGTTQVACTATDGSGNHTQGSFTVQVTVSWSNLLAPINPLGLSVFLRGLPVAVKFTLTGGSAGITNLGARLFVAPVDTAGNVGAERPAVGGAPALDNLFRFVPLVSQYLLTLNTTGMQSGVWQLRIDLGDGVSHTARIRLL